MTPERKGDEMTTMAEDRVSEHERDEDQHEERRRDGARRRDEPGVEDVGAATDDDAPSPAGGPPRWVLIALVAWGAVMLAIAAWSFLRADSLADARDDRRAAASVAGEFASATMSYDHRDLDGSLAAVTDLATADYAETYQNAFFEELQPVVDELRARGRVHVRDVYVSDISDDTATAVVSFDAVIRSTIGTRRLAGSYVRVDLVKEGGAWKADDLTFLATTQEGLDGPTGASATTGTEGATTATTTPAG